MSRRSWVWRNGSTTMAWLIPCVLVFALTACLLYIAVAVYYFVGLITQPPRSLRVPGLFLITTLLAIVSTVLVVWGLRKTAAAFDRWFADTVVGTGHAGSVIAAGLTTILFGAFIGTMTPGQGPSSWLVGIGVALTAGATLKLYDQITSVEENRKALRQHLYQAYFLADQMTEADPWARAELAARITSAANASPIWAWNKSLPLQLGEQVVNGTVDRELLNWCLSTLQGPNDYFWASMHRVVYEFEFGQLPRNMKAMARVREHLRPGPASSMREGSSSTRQKST